jgi:UDP:flavonoid glycosyltransferase YjiC (YdhE family)
MAAVVHQGGAGTFALAARAGVPQFITPVFGDQIYWGRLASRLALGPRPVSLSSLTARKLERALIDLGTPERTEAARRTAERLGGSPNGVEGAANRIEAAVAAWAPVRAASDTS